MNAPTRDELAELRSFTVSTVNDALRLLNVKDSLLDHIGILEALNRQLREALEKIRDRDGACECDDHSSPECCANIEWNDGSCCPHCVAGAALAATEPR